MRYDSQHRQRLVSQPSVYRCRRLFSGVEERLKRPKPKSPKSSSTSTKIKNKCTFICTPFIGQYRTVLAEPAGRAALGVGLRLFACWYCGFESRREHGCLSLVSVVSCHVEVFATGRSLTKACHRFRLINISQNY